jgi:hypothetical protein
MRRDASASQQLGYWDSPVLYNRSQLMPDERISPSSGIRKEDKSIVMKK